MRLIRLTSRAENATFDSFFNSDIILKPNAKIALQSVSINNINKVVVVTTDNNEIQYQLNNQIIRTINLTPKNYASSQIADLLFDIMNKLNDDATFSGASGERKILGIEWKTSINAGNLVDIQYAFNPEGSNPFKTEWDFKGVSFTGENLSATADTSSERFNRNAILPYNMSRGNGFFRCRTLRLDAGTPANLKNGYIMGVVDSGDVTNDNLGMTDIKYGIRVNMDGAGNRYYQTIIDGVEDTTQHAIATYSSGANTNETQEIAINGGQIEINIYASGSTSPTHLATIPIVRTPTTDMGLNLKPVVAFFGSKSTTQVTNVRFTATPYGDDLPQGTHFNEDNVSELTAPPRPPNRRTDDPNKLVFQSLSVAEFLGFNNQSIPLFGTIPSPQFGLSYISDHEFAIPQEADAMLVQLLSLNLESYDSYADINESGGQRSNLLAVIPQTNDTGKIVYQANPLIFLELNNKDSINLRNISLRVVREDYQQIPTIGLNTVVLIIE